MKNVKCQPVFGHQSRRVSKQSIRDSRDKLDIKIGGLFSGAAEGKYAVDKLARIIFLVLALVLLIIGRSSGPLTSIVWSWLGVAGHSCDEGILTLCGHVPGGWTGLTRP